LREPLLVVLSAASGAFAWIVSVLSM